MSTVLSEISNFEMIEPKYFLTQEQACNWTSLVHKASASFDPEADLQRLEVLQRRYGIKEKQIAFRRFEVDDVLKTDTKDMKIYDHSPQGTDIKSRTQFFFDKSNQVFQSFYKDKAQGPEQLIHVTCTGYISPSAPQMLVSQKNWSPKTGITHAYHMGCYAALPAVRMGEAFVSAKAILGESIQVDVVHTEICSLHMNPSVNTPEQIIVQSLFADGHIKYSLSRAGTSTQGYSVLKVMESVVPDSAQDMSWVPSSWGMEMSLSRDVPSKIKSQIKNFVKELLLNTGVSPQELFTHGLFAIHPGGPKIISSIQETLELRKDQVAASKEVLLNRGNMSSATLPHIWKLLLETNYKSNRPILSLAFGPGLTIFGSVFRMI